MPSNKVTDRVDHIEDEVSRETLAAAKAGLKWGVTPKINANKMDEKDGRPGPNHPVHLIPAEGQEKMRSKGVNPVLYAEMNRNKLEGKGTFWSKVSQTAMGGGCIK
ncbi:hypothetical protein ZTR_06392 [Talaromyces verruculosus]|nr:hypothetical protein ZTR_06392 [Talaromyces verruculosus]